MSHSHTQSAPYSFQRGLLAGLLALSATVLFSACATGTEDRLVNETGQPVDPVNVQAPQSEPAATPTSVPAQAETLPQPDDDDGWQEVKGAHSQALEPGKRIWLPRHAHVLKGQAGPRTELTVQLGQFRCRYVAVGKSKLRLSSCSDAHQNFLSIGENGQIELEAGDRLLVLVSESSVVTSLRLRFL